MGIRFYKPTTAGRRFASVSDFSELTTRKPEKSLLEPLRKTGGRNTEGKITAEHIGGGVGRHYRIIRFLNGKRIIFLQKLKVWNTTLIALHA